MYTGVEIKVPVQVSKKIRKADEKTPVRDTIHDPYQQVPTTFSHRPVCSFEIVVYQY